MLATAVTISNPRTGHADNGHRNADNSSKAGNRGSSTKFTNLAILIKADNSSNRKRWLPYAKNLTYKAGNGGI